MFLAVGSLGATHEEAHLRDSGEVSGRVDGRERKRMEAEWKKERKRLQKNNTLDFRERQQDGLKKKKTRKHKIWSFSTGEIETTQGLQTEIQADRQTDPKWLCQSVHDQLVHDSTVTHLHLTTIPPTPLCRFVDYTDAPSHPSYVSQRGCDMTSGGPRACSWQLFISHPLQSLPCCGPSVKCFQPCSCSSAPHAS